MERFLAELWNMRWQLAEGLLVTVEVSAAAIVIGSVVGLFVGIGLAFGGRPLRWPLRAYVDVVRGTPVLVLILAAFYILAAFGVQFTATGSGIFALSLFCGAHLGEIFRGALQAIPATQIEAGKSMGLQDAADIAARPPAAGACGRCCRCGSTRRWRSSRPRRCCRSSASASCC